MTSDTLATDRMWKTTVCTPRGALDDYEYTHVGPAEYKLDGAGNLRIEVYPENSDFEVVIGLHLAGTFVAVGQEVLPEETDKGMIDPDAAPPGLAPDGLPWRETESLDVLREQLREPIRRGDLAIKDEPEGSEFGD